jgi:hypothetical protein
MVKNTPVEFELDEAMLGDMWHGTKNDLLELGMALEEQLNVQQTEYLFSINVVMDAWNSGKSLTRLNPDIEPNQIEEIRAYINDYWDLVISDFSECF